MFLSLTPARSVAWPRTLEEACPTSSFSTLHTKYPRTYDAWCPSTAQAGDWRQFAGLRWPTSHACKQTFVFPQVLHQHCSSGQKWTRVPRQKSRLSASCAEESDRRRHFPEEWKGTKHFKRSASPEAVTTEYDPAFVTPCFRWRTVVRPSLATSACGRGRVPASSPSPATSEVSRSLRVRSSKAVRPFIDCLRAGLRCSGNEKWWNWWKNLVSAFFYRRSPVSWLVREVSVFKRQSWGFWNDCMKQLGFTNADAGGSRGLSGRGDASFQNPHHHWSLLHCWRRAGGRRCCYYQGPKGPRWYLAPGAAERRVGGNTRQVSVVQV